MTQLTINLIIICITIIVLAMIGRNNTKRK